MHKSRMTALILASLVSLASQASAQSAPATRDGTRAGKAIGRGGERGPNGKALFRGVTLSEAEKTKLKAIRQTYHAETQTLRGTLAPARKEVRAARQRGDTVAARAAFERTKADREKLRELMQRQKTDIRGALSAENQRKFDENLKQVVQRHEGRGRGAKRGGERGAQRGARGEGKAGRQMHGRGRRGANG